MGWASGSSILEEVLSITYEHLPKKKRKKLCKVLIECFEDNDCDTIQEVFDDKWPEVEEAYWELHPDEWEEV